MAGDAREKSDAMARSCGSSESDPMYETRRGRLLLLRARPPSPPRKSEAIKGGWLCESAAAGSGVALSRGPRRRRMISACEAAMALSSRPVHGYCRLASYPIPPIPMAVADAEDDDEEVVASAWRRASQFACQCRQSARNHGFDGLSRLTQPAAIWADCRSPLPCKADASAV